MSPATPLYWFEASLLVALLLLPLLRLLKIRRSSGTSSPKSCLPPSPPKLPIIGNLHQLGSLPHRSLRELSEKHGPLILLHLGRVPTLVVSSADAAREIMKTHDLTFASRPSMKIAHLLTYESTDLGFSPYGEHWRQMRKLCVTHLLSVKMVQSIRLMREEEVALMVDKITSLASLSTGVVDMSEVLYSFSNDLICRIISGKFFREERRNAWFRQLTMETTLLFGSFHVEDYLPSLAWLDVFFGLTARAKRCFKAWDGILDEIIKDHEERSPKSSSKSEDFADVLLSLRKDPNTDLDLTKDHIKALLMVIILALKALWPRMFNGRAWHGPDAARGANPGRKSELEPYELRDEWTEFRVPYILKIFYTSIYIYIYINWRSSENMSARYRTLTVAVSRPIEVEKSERLRSSASCGRDRCRTIAAG